MTVLVEGIQSVSINLGMINLLRQVRERCSSSPWKTYRWVLREQEHCCLNGEDEAGWMVAIKGGRRRR